MKLLFAISTVLFLGLSATAQRVVCIETGEAVSSDISTKPTRTVEQLDNGVRVTYRFDFMMLDSSHTNEDEVYTISFQDFGTTLTPGQQALPARMDVIKVPNGCSASVTIDSIMYEDYYFEIATAHELNPEQANTPLNSNMSIRGATNEFTPNHPIMLNSLQEYKDQSICFVNVVPVIYNHDQKTVRIARELSYTVNFEQSNQLNSRSLNTTYEPITCPILENLVVNSSTKDNNVQEIDLPQDYLIITTSDLRPALEQFIDWKKALGFTVHVICQNEWVDDTEVRDSIVKYYKAYPAINYLLIVGNHAKVPGTIIKSENNHITDFYYAQRQSDPTFIYLPEIYAGRIPTATLIDTQNALKKIIAYEVCENLISPNFFSNSLHCATFETGLYKYCENARFIRTSEEILNSAKDNSIIPSRVYINTSNSYPLQYSLSKLYSTNDDEIGQRLPDELLDPSFNWYGTVDEVSSLLMQGVQYVLYRGHGFITGWQAPAYSIDEIAKDTYPSLNASSNSYIDEYVHPIFFSVTCNTGKHDEPNCFTSKLLSQELGGSAGVYAATEESKSGYNDAFLLGLFDSMFDNPVNTTFIHKRDNTSFFKLYRTGHLLTQGRFRMAEKYVLNPLLNPSDDSESYNINKSLSDEYELLHYFGDPSMLIRTVNPSSFSNASVELDPETKICRVKTGEGPAIISFYDKNNNSVKSYYGTEAEFQFSEIHYDYGPATKDLIGYENVVISAPNKIPFIKNKWGSDNSVGPVRITSSFILANYKIDSNAFAFITVTNVFTGEVVSRTTLYPWENSVVIDISKLAAGSYIMSFIVNDQVCKSISFRL